MKRKYFLYNLILKKICVKYVIQMKIWDKYIEENSELFWEYRNYICNIIEVKGDY